MVETKKSERATRTSEQEQAIANAPKDSASVASSGTASKKKRREKNNVRKLRTERMMSKAELARRAGLSNLTIDRVEKGMPCRMDTKRKILEALGLTPADRLEVFGEDD
jgi:DNA-binding XRE family transcriptional regulator